MKRLTGVFLLFVMASVVFCGSSYLLTGKYALKKDSVYSYDITNKTDQVIDSPMGEMNMENNSEMKMTLKVLESAANGNSKVEFTFDEFKYSSVGNPQGDAEGRVDQVIGKSAVVEINGIGKTENITAKESLKYTVMGQEQTMEDNIKRFFLEVMPKGMNAGDTWDVSYTNKSSSGVTTSGTTTYTIKEKTSFNGKNCILIESTGVIKLSGSIQSGGMDIDMEGKGKSKGTVYFDNINYVLLENKSTSNTDITMNIAGMGEMGMTQVSKSEIKLAPVK